jgi:alginate O-acetyltransferase complex protein AlgI
MVGWVFFRSDSFRQAGAMLGAMSGLTGANRDDVIPWGWVFDTQALVTLGLAAGISLIPWHRLAAQRWFQSLSRAGNQGILATGATVGRFVIAATLLFSATTTLVSLGYTPFLYFRF